MVFTNDATLIYENENVIEGLLEIFYEVLEKDILKKVGLKQNF